MVYFNSLCFLICIGLLNLNSINSTDDILNDNSCFTKLNGNVDDCDCKIDDIRKFNNYQIRPRLIELLQKDYFRYFKVNLNKICQFWPDDARCSIKDCLVKSCSDDDLPHAFQKYLKEENLDDVLVNEDMGSNCEQLNPLGHLNETITDENLKTFEEWRKYDDSLDNFCEPDDEYVEKAKYYDLLTNPERYTGYKGEHAHKIWGSIYKENCFKDSYVPAYGDSNFEDRNTCLEKRAFYRLVSGLHASINIHLCSNYLHKGYFGQPDYWGPAPDEFQKRFDPKTTYGQGPQWLKNLYFLYLLELRAIAKVAPYLERQIFFTGNTVEDEDMKNEILDFLKTAKGFKHHFDERKLFKGNQQEAKILKDEFKTKFRNITKIMDCVGCDKCRLWGKLQTQALGTALKILFSNSKINSNGISTLKQDFQLSRSEIVALFNGFGRISTSIIEIENFRDLLSLN